MVDYKTREREERRSTLPRNGADWTPERVDLLKRMWLDGRSASEIARALGQGVSRSGVLGKVHRLKIPGHGRNDLKTKRSHKAGQSYSDKPHGNKGVPKARGIVARRQAAEEARQRSELQHSGNEPFRAGVLPISDDLPDVTDRIGLMQLDQRRQCHWISGDPLAEHSFCAQPVAGEGKPYCEEHMRRAYVKL